MGPALITYVLVGLGIFNAITFLMAMHVLKEARSAREEILEYQGRLINLARRRNDRWRNHR